MQVFLCHLNLRPILVGTCMEDSDLNLLVIRCKLNKLLWGIMKGSSSILICEDFLDIFKLIADTMSLPEVPYCLLGVHAFDFDRLVTKDHCNILEDEGELIHKCHCVIIVTLFVLPVALLDGWVCFVNVSYMYDCPLLFLLNREHLDHITVIIEEDLITCV